MARLRKSSPWIIFYRELQELFRYDDEVKVIYDDNPDEALYEVRLYVETTVKADALEKLLPTEKVFGNVTLTIKVIPANTLEHTNVPLYEAAFEGNEALSYIKTVGGGILSNDITYVVFKNQVVQYFSDDLSDPHGLTSTLYQDIAERVFEQKEGIFFCTDIPEENEINTDGILTYPLKFINYSKDCCE